MWFLAVFSGWDATWSICRARSAAARVEPVVDRFFRTAPERWQSGVEAAPSGGTASRISTENSEGATMKPTTTAVKVCSTELNDSRSKGPVTDEGREASPESTTECPKRPAAIPQSRDEPHRMSSESSTTGKPSHSSLGEGCQDRAGRSGKDIGPKSLMSDQRAGGVCGGGGSRRGVRLSGEACGGGVSSDAPTSGASVAKG